MTSIRQPHRQAYQFPDKESTDTTNDPQPIKLLSKLRTTTPVNGQEGTAQPIPPQPPQEPQPTTGRRNLPAVLTDLIRDGNTAQQLETNGHIGIRTSILRTASSAIQRGWSEEEWIALLEEPESKLGTQFRETYHKRQIIKQPKFIIELGKLWSKSEQWLASRPPAYTHRQIEEELDRIRETMEGSGLGPTDRTILTTAITIAEANGTTRPALPRRLLMESTGLGLTATRNSLARLERAGWLELAVPGRSGRPKEGEPGKANLYRLLAPVGTPKHGLWCPPKKAPPAPDLFYGAPPEKPGTEMVPPQLKKSVQGACSMGPPHSSDEPEQPVPVSRVRAVYEEWLARQSGGRDNYHFTPTSTRGDN